MNYNGSDREKSSPDPFHEVDIAAQLADLKLHVYQQSIMLSALIELLIEKQYFSYEEFIQTVMRLDQEMGSE